MVGCQKDPYSFNDLKETVKSFFTTSDTNFDMDAEIKFKNASENSETYSWDFGDGTKSTEKDPVKSFATAGNFTVTLKAVGPGGTGNYSSEFTIIDPSQTADNYKDLYFIENGNKAIKKISLEPGLAAEMLADISGKVGVGLAYDSVNAKIIFSDFTTTGNGKIWRMNPDGTNIEELVSGITKDPYSVVLNLTAGKMYWADNGGNIGRANLDGTGLEREFIHIDGGQMRGIAYSNKKDLIYFYEVDNEDLYVAKADGTGVTKLIEGAFGYCIFVDDVNGTLYYEDRNIPAIMRVKLDGSDPKEIAKVPGTRIHGMAIDYNANKFYFADRDKAVIKRSNLDGTESENFLSNLKSPRGIVIQ